MNTKAKAKAKILHLSRLFSIAIFHLFVFTLSAQTNLVPDGATTSAGQVGQYVDYLVPDTMTSGILWLEAYGADGGRRDKTLSGTLYRLAKGGEGARIKASFHIGHKSNEIPPGSVIRVFAGEKGNDESSSLHTGAGGGGSSIHRFAIQEDREVRGHTFYAQHGKASYQICPDITVSAEPTIIPCEESQNGEIRTTA